MSKSNDINIKVKASNEASSALNEAKKNLDDLGSAAKDLPSALSAVGSSWQNLAAGVASGMAAFEGITLAINKVKEAISELSEATIGYNMRAEQFKIAFSNLTGSMDNGLEHMRELKDFAENTPFDTMGMYKMSQELQGFGFELDEIIPMLNTFGSVAARGGKSAENMAEALRQFSQARAKGHFDMQDINSFASNLGVNAKKIIMDSLNIPFDDINKTSIDRIAPVLLNKMQEMGKGMLDAQSKTAQGMINNIKESFQNAVGTLGEPIFDMFKGLLEKVQGVTEYFKALVNGEVNDEISKFFGNLKNFAVQLTEFIDKILEFTGIYDYLSYLAEGLELVAGAIGVFVSESLAVFAEGLADANQAIEDFKAWGIETFGGFYEEAKGLFISLYNSCTEIFDTCRSVWNNIFSGAFGELLSTIVDFVEKAFWFLRPLIKAINYVAEKVGGSANKIISEAPEKPDYNVDWNKLWHAGNGTNTEQGQKGKSSSAADKEARAAERMADKIENSWQKLMDKISDAADSVYARGMKRLQREIGEYQKQIAEATQYGIDTTAIELALADYAKVMREKLTEKWEDAMNGLKAKTATLVAGMSSNFSVIFDASMGDSAENLRKEIRELKKELLTGDADKDRNILANIGNFEEIRKVQNLIDSVGKAFDAAKQKYNDFINLENINTDILGLGGEYRWEKQREGLKEYIESLKAAQTEINKQIHTEYEELYAVDASTAEYERHRTAITALDEAYKRNMTVIGQAVHQMQMLGTGNAWDDLKQGFAEYCNNIKSAAEYTVELGQQIAEEFASTISQGFDDLINGELKSFVDYFKDFAKSIMSMIMQIYTKLLTTKLIGMIMPGLGMKATGGYIPGYATGGTVPGYATGGKTFLVGENSPELVTLNGSGAIVTSGGTTRRKMQENNTPNVTINIVNQSGQQLEAKQQGGHWEADNYIIDVVMSAVANNKMGMRTMLSAI